jgi:hypothetical protein
LAGAPELEMSMTANSAATARNGSKLSDTALIILGAAVQRNDHLLLPVPTSISASPDVINKTIKSLMSKAMVEERPAKLEDVVWRKDEQDQKFTLSITDVGVAALDDGPREPDQDGGTRELANGQTKGSTSSGKKTNTKPEKSTKRKPADKRAKSHPRNAGRETKAGQVLALLSRSHGATLAEMMKATGWQAHSVRGFLSGTVKKRMGLAVTSEQAEGKDRRYRAQA